ncbi:MAG: ASKHA domain-containing protein, partial [Desulfobacteraceae bacterium]|nr:ASKHA domain-containing protein [Desulfobacteraceae bacterium]
MIGKSDGWVVTVSVSPPSLNDNTADADRLINELKSVLKTDYIDIDLPLLKNLPWRLRKWDYQVRCVCFKDRSRWKLVGVKSIKDSVICAGIAVDLGTTRVVLRLINLETGEAVNETAFDNPQIAIGPDILERIHSAGDASGLDQINRLIVEGFNDNISAICKKSGVNIQDIFLLAVSGNTSMCHLFLGLPPNHIIREPYIPVVNTFNTFLAKEIGIQINDNARIFIFPNVGSYFGGDLISGIIYSRLHTQDDISILVDVGTNAEVVLGNKDWLVACAGAAGPALEGGVSKIGMNAKPGVIDRIVIDPETGAFDLHTIDELPPKGICGSGMIDMMAQLFLSGMVDIRGKFVVSKCGDRLKESDGIRRIVLAPAEASAIGKELSISQVDIDSLIRSKAAMYTILETIARYVGITFDDFSKFYIAGTFGSFINPRSAISIGMIPDLPEGTYQSLGNSSL